MDIISFLPIDRTLSDATTLDQSAPESDEKEEVFIIPQSSNVTGTSPSDCLLSYPGNSLGVGSYSSSKMQSVYSTTPAKWATFNFNFVKFKKNKLNVYNFTFILR